MFFTASTFLIKGDASETNQGNYSKRKQNPHQSRLDKDNKIKQEIHNKTNTNPDNINATNVTTKSYQNVLHSKPSIIKYQVFLLSAVVEKCWC